MRMNAHQAEAAYGTPRMTTGRWIRSGKLTADGDGYFDEEDFKVLDARRLTLAAPGRKSAAPPKKKAAKKKAVKKRPPAKKKLLKKKAAPKKRATTKAPASGKDDALYLSAVEVCENTGRYTVSSLQRQLRIGYNRADRLLNAVLDGKPSIPPQPKLATKPQAAIKGPGQHESFNPMMAGSRQEVDLRKALANARKAEMEVKIKMKDLISRELVSRVFRKIYSIDATEWRGLGPRLAPDVLAACEVEDPTKEVEVSDRIEQEVFRTLDHVKRVINAFLEEIESEDRIDDE